MLERVSKGPTRVRTLFILDIHLGTKGCQADKLIDFLRHYQADTIYLVGDIVDRRGVDGVICGHIHHAVIRSESGFCQINCGDWVESCTAAVEHFDGRFEIVQWIGRGPSFDGSGHAVAPLTRREVAAPAVSE